MLPDMSGFDLIEKIREENEHLPIIVYTAKDLSEEEEEKLNRVAQTTIVKNVRSPERLFDQTALWLHRDAATLPEDKRELLRRLNDPNEVLAGKKVVIVDDDIRNIFAMTSMLERYKMEVHSAETGKAALELLQKEGRYRLGADGHHAARDGWLRNHSLHSEDVWFRTTADHRVDGKGDERRSRKMHRRRRERLHCQAGRYGTPASRYSANWLHR